MPPSALVKPGGCSTFLSRHFAPAIVLVILALCQLAWFIPRDQVAWDFGQFWANGRLPLSIHRTAEGMTMATTQLLQRFTGENGPFLRLPVFVLLSKPLGLFEYWTAFKGWVVAQFCILCVFLLLLRRRTQIPWVFVALQGLWVPAMFGIVMGHDPGFVPLLCLAGFLFLERNKAGLAGLLFGLCLYKFQLMALLPAFLLLQKRYRTFVYFAGSGVILLLLSHSMMPFPEYWKLISAPRFDVTALMIGLRQLAWVTGYSPLYWSAVGVMIPVSLVAMWRTNLQTSFAIAITVSVFAAPHVNFYDYVLLLVPLFFMSQETRLFGIYTAAFVAWPMLWLDRTAAGLLVLVFWLLLISRSIRSPLRDTATSPGTCSLAGQHSAL
jgi:hypothetical protein